MNTKSIKILLGVGLGVVVIGFAYYNRDTIKETLSNTFGGGSSTKKEETPVKKDLVCPAGQIPCMFNKNKCYDPTLPSFVDPCA
jgi:hypothetical protein